MPELNYAVAQPAARAAGPQTVGLVTTSTTLDAQPLALSTSWNGAQATSPATLLDAVASLGFRRIEAYAHFTPPALAALAAEARARGMEIGSLHGPCPIPVDDVSGAPTRWGDPLASTDQAERRRAVGIMKRTVDAAAEVGARAVVVHLGTTGALDSRRAVLDALERHGRGSDEHRRALDDAARQRAGHSGPALEAGIRTLRELGEHAVGTGVRLGVEVRDGYPEIPFLDEIGQVLDACAGLPVGYWHDAGHGAKLAYLGFLPSHEELLRRYADRMIGMHVHDTHGTRDHLAPGQGETDFGMLARNLRPGVLKTLELHSTARPEEITWGVEEVLRPLDAFGVAEGVVYQA